MFDVSERNGVIVDLDTGTVTGTNVMFIRAEVWEEVDEYFCSGAMTDNEVNYFALRNGVRPSVH